MISKFIHRLVVLVVLNIAGLFLTIYLFKLNWNHHFWSLTALALFLALCHLIIKPIISFFLKPFIWLTFGLLSLILNILILKIGLYYLPVITISQNTTLILVALILSLLNSFGTLFSKK